MQILYKISTNKIFFSKHLYLFNNTGQQHEFKFYQVQQYFANPHLKICKIKKIVIGTRKNSLISCESKTSLQTLLVAAVTISCQLPGFRGSAVEEESSLGQAGKGESWQCQAYNSLLVRGFLQLILCITSLQLTVLFFQLILDQFAVDSAFLPADLRSICS